MSPPPAVILVGHGSARHPDSAAVFMKQPPLLAEALDLVNAEEVVIVPVFAGKGYYTESLIPEAMGLTGSVTRRDGRVLRYTQPAGCDPRIPGLMACRADGVARASGLDPKAASLLLIAHGSARPGGSGETPKAVAAAIAAMEHFAEIRLAFLEQPPFASDWRNLVAGKDLVVLPFLVAQGMHASQDIPPLFGLASGETGPVTIDGRRALLATGLGAEAELVDIVAEMVTAATLSAAD